MKLSYGTNWPDWNLCGSFGPIFMVLGLPTGWFPLYFHRQAYQELICRNRDLLELGHVVVKVKRFQSNNNKVGLFLSLIKIHFNNKNLSEVAMTERVKT